MLFDQRFVTYNKRTSVAKLAQFERMSRRNSAIPSKTKRKMFFNNK